MKKGVAAFRFYYTTCFFLAIAAVFLAFIGRQTDQTRDVFICVTALGAGCALLAGGVRRHGGFDRQAAVSFLVCGTALWLSFGAQHTTWGLPGDLSISLVPFLFFIAVPVASLLVSVKIKKLCRFKREDLPAVLLCLLSLALFDGSIAALYFTGGFSFFAAANALLYLLPVWYFALGEGFRFVPALCFAGTMAHLYTATKLLIALAPPQPADYLKAVFQDTLIWLALSLLYGFLCFAFLKIRGQKSDFINGSAST